MLTSRTPLACRSCTGTPLAHSSSQTLPMESMCLRHTLRRPLPTVYRQTQLLSQEQSTTLVQPRHPPRHRLPRRPLRRRLRAPAHRLLLQAAAAAQASPSSSPPRPALLSQSPQSLQRHHLEVVNRLPPLLPSLRRAKRRVMELLTWPPLSRSCLSLLQSPLPQCLPLPFRFLSFLAHPLCVLLFPSHPDNCSLSCFTISDNRFLSLSLLPLQFYTHLHAHPLPHTPFLCLYLATPHIDHPKGLLRHCITWP